MTCPPRKTLRQETSIHARSITLSSNRLGVIAKLDLIEARRRSCRAGGLQARKRPHIARGAYDPERVQGMLAGPHSGGSGYSCMEGVLYFVESRERVPVIFDQELRDLTMSALHGLRGVALGGRIPAPLEDSPKCPRCSLVGICLPDEVNFLKRGETPPRAIAIGLTESLPALRASSQGEGCQGRRQSGSHRGRQGRCAAAPGGNFSGRPSGKRLHDDTDPARTDAPRNSRRLA